MDINIVRYIFIFNSLFTGLIGLLINFLEPYLSVLITRTYRYGKYSAKMDHALVAKFEVSKRWYKHFYIFAGPASTITLCLIFYKYLYNGDISEIVFTLLDILFGASRKPLVSAEDVILAIVILNIHCWKRVYETCYVNIFSNKKIHIFHYIIGFVHYVGAFLCIIGESEGFVRGSHSSFSLHKLISMKIVCAFIFLYSSYMQLRTNLILAKLRKNEHGDVVFYGYKVPVGGLFNYISAPLQLTEILVYLMLSVILWEASTFHYITIWVITNQIECAVLTHQWYREAFQNYPKEKKIIIPYIWKFYTSLIKNGVS